MKDLLQFSFKNDINVPHGCFDSYWFFTLMPRDVHRSTVWSFGAQVPHRMPRHFRSKNLLHDVEQSFIAPYVLERLKWRYIILIVKIITLNTIKVLPYLRCCMKALYFWHFLWFKQKYIWSRVCFFQFGKSLEQPIFFKFFCNENLNWW